MIWRTTRMPSGALSRFWAMFKKEIIQLRRDRVSFTIMVLFPLGQLLLFGYAINTDPRHLPTVLLMQEETDIGRSILAALNNTSYFDIKHMARSEAEMDAIFASGEVLFAVEIPAGFARAVRRGEKPALLVIADATDPMATGMALASLERIVGTALARDRVTVENIMTDAPFEIVQHRRNNPAGKTEINIVPGLLGTILTMTMLLFTSLSVTREVERGTMENLLAMPLNSLEIMLGKIAPYIFIGFMQATIIFIAGLILFNVPMLGNILELAILTILFITTNLAVGYTFSTLAKTQLQAMQISVMWYLPNIMLSGFVFPFAGMPQWAQWLGETLPLTHFLRIVRNIMLKGSTLWELRAEAVWLIVLTLIAATFAMVRFRHTID